MGSLASPTSRDHDITGTLVKPQAWLSWGTKAQYLWLQAAIEGSGFRVQGSEFSTLELPFDPRAALPPPRAQTEKTTTTTTKKNQTLTHTCTHTLS